MRVQLLVGRGLEVSQGENESTGQNSAKKKAHFVLEAQGYH